METRNYHYDLIKGIAILCVLIIHSSLRFNTNTTEIMIGDWFATFTRPCIGIFLFISGILYFNKSLSFHYFFKKIKRLIAPYLFFSFLALIFVLIVQKQQISLVQIILNLIIGNTFGIYYYCFVIIVIFTITFVLDYFGLLKKHLKTIVLITLFINLLHNSLFHFVMLKLGINESLIEFIGYRSIFIWLFFFYLGVYYKQMNIDNIIKKNRDKVIRVWLITFVFYNMLWSMNISNTDGYTSVIGTIYSTTTIFLLMSIKLKRNAFLEFLGQSSYTIYLSHIFFVYYLVELQSRLNTTFPVYFNGIAFCLALAGSLLVVYLGKVVLRKRSKLLIGC